MTNTPIAATEGGLLPCPCAQPRPDQYPADKFTEVTCRHSDSVHGVRTFIPRSDRKDVHDVQPS